LLLSLSQLHKTSGVQVWRGTVGAVVAIATGIWFWIGHSLSYGLDFLLDLWLFFLGVLALDKGSLPWLAIGLLPKLLCLSRLRFSRVAFVPMVG
jgi:hypothetical protein